MIHTTLMFVIDGEEVLLMMKKRGFGAGKWNGPGGKYEKGDDGVLQTAIRETEEEVGVTPQDIMKVGELEFAFGDELVHFCHVYRADDYIGEPQESEEARPGWFHTSDVPYDDMWPDDRHWFPNVVHNNWFEGQFHFDGETNELLSWRIEGETR